MIIKDAPIVDLRGIAAGHFAGLERVENVRTVILDTSNADAFMRVPRVDVRSHVIVQPDEQVIIGQQEFDDLLLSGLADGTRLVLLGQALIDGFTPELFLRKVDRLRLFGQALYADTVSAGAFLSRTERLQGQLLPMPCGAQRWIGSNTLTVNRLRSLAQRPLVSIGTITIDPQVDPSDINEHLVSMVQIGEVKGRESAVCALLARCTVRLGTVSLSQEQTKPAGPSALRVVSA
jgi:hypothetical protein